MRAISAVDAVSPAVHRTKEFLFRPFTWGTYLKLCLVAIITEGSSANLRSNSNNAHPSGQPPNLHGLPGIHSLADIQPMWIAAGVAMLLLVAVIVLSIAYLITRLRFAYFHCMVHNIKELRPGWHLHRDQAVRFFWLNVSVGFCFLLLVGLIAIPFVSGFWRLVHQIPPGGHPDWGLLISLVLPLIPIILLLVLLGVVVDLVLRDGMLPHYALEDATAGQAWAHVAARIGAEKRQFLVYAVLRLILPILAWIAMFILLIIPGLMLAGAVGAIEYGLHSAFTDAAGVTSLTGILLEVFFGVLAFGLAVLASICLGGPLSTATREYALIFYGGRYQALGDALDASTPLQAPPAPRFA